MSCLVPSGLSFLSHPPLLFTLPATGPLIGYRRFVILSFMAIKLINESAG